MQPHGFACIFKRSASLRVVEQAACSVMVAQGKIKPIRRFLLCDCGADETRLLETFASKIVEFFGGEEEITVLNVMSYINARLGISGMQLQV